MLMDIKIRLLRLGKKQVDLIPALREYGLYVTADVLCRIINGTRQSLANMAVLSAIYEILRKWEAARGMLFEDADRQGEEKESEKGGEVNGSDEKCCTGL